MEFPSTIQTPGVISSNHPLADTWWNFPQFQVGTCRNFLQVSRYWCNFLQTIQTRGLISSNDPLNRLLRHVIIVADNGLIDVHLTLLDVVSRRLWIIRTSHLHKLTDECTHHCFYILIVVITLKTKPECKKLVINCILGNICPLFIFPTFALIVNGHWRLGKFKWLK